MANTDDRNRVRIVIEADGPYHVHADIPLVRKMQVVSEYGEPLTWKPEGAIKTSGAYKLCRCGQSSDKPFCDDTHWGAGFDGTETTDTGPTAARQITYEGSTGIVIKRDHSLCTEAGFCGTRLASIEQLAAKTSDTDVRSQVIAMIERCPSGSLVYAMAEGEPEIEPDLPAQIAVTTEITSDGPIAGPLWVTGNIPIERADGQPFETRNRVTLCNCGRSESKPLCDGTHRTAGL
ncbi:MAG: CDGSH iron-sulfur domain-containing protein [Chloroflexi bacterium]|nr:CDGSH iron-sulfur domain-containing protein [Chloroflexota bacterium]